MTTIDLIKAHKDLINLHNNGLIDDKQYAEESKRLFQKI
jgi:hypothetical protein